MGNSIGGLLILLFYFNWWTTNEVKSGPRCTIPMRQRNKTYPLTPPIIAGDTSTFRIGIVADLDKNSKCKSEKGVWYSYYKRGYLSYNKADKHVTVTWDSQPPVKITSTYSRKMRGMELSEFIVFDGRLLTFDDRCGLIYEILNNNTVVPWVKLQDGNGYEEKGFKVEWASVRDDILYIGSTGKEWVSGDGDIENYNPMWVKTVDIYGGVHHNNWVNQYESIRGANGIHFPGYMIHEAAAWSSVKQKWHFLPRKCNSNPYNNIVDELMGCNLLISADAEFSSRNLLSVEITKRQRGLGFSSFKFIPGTDDEVIVALKTMEHEDRTSTYITVFTTDGQELLPDTHIENNKYEGIEFV